MAIPAGDVGRIKSGRGFRFDDEVLEDFIKGGTKVNFAVGVRGAVMEQVRGAASSSLSNLAVEVFGFPPGQDGRLCGGEVGFHRKARAGKI